MSDYENGWSAAKESWFKNQAKLVKGDDAFALGWNDGIKSFRRLAEMRWTGYAVGGERA